MFENCCVCSEKIIMNGNRLSDGNMLCHKCAKKIPSEISGYALTYWNKEVVITFFEYRKYSENVMLPVFNEEYRLGKISFDETHGLYKLTDKTLLFAISDTNDMNFLFEPKKIEHPVLRKPYATGESKLFIEQRYPPFRTTITLSTYAKASGYMENGRFHTRLPDDLEKFRLAVSRCKSRIEQDKQIAREKEKRQRAAEDVKKKAAGQQTHEENRVKQNDLDKAMSLFMLDSLIGITEGDIKKQRNRLLKTFHPDEGEESAVYAQKINKAYEALLKAIN